MGRDKGRSGGLAFSHLTGDALIKKVLRDAREAVLCG